MNIAIILDLFVITCLAITIFFAVRLNKRLSTIYKSRDDLQAFLNQFSVSLEKADAGIKDLRGIGESVFKTTQDQLKAAEALKSDLEFLNERGEDIAQKLDQSIREARQFITHINEQKPSHGFHDQTPIANTAQTSQNSSEQNRTHNPAYQKAPANESHIQTDHSKRQPADVIQRLQNIR